MKTKNVVISALSALSIVLFVMLMFSFINQQNIQYKAVVALDKIHTIYLNFDNPITVVVPGVPKEKVIVKCAEVPAKSLGDSKYSIPVMDPLLANKKVHLSVFILNTAGKEQFIETLEYLVLTVPEPLAYFAYKSGGNLTLGEAMTTDSLYVAIPGFYYEGFRFQVSKFLMMFIDSLGNGMTYPGDNGSRINPMQKTALNSVYKGVKINFIEIYATYTDPITKKPGNEIHLPKNIEFTVVK